MSDNPHLEELARRIPGETSVEELLATSKILRLYLIETVTALITASKYKYQRKRLSKTLADLAEEAGA